MMELRELVDKIQDQVLKQKVLDLVADPTIRIGENTYSGLPLESSPASRHLHHSYPGGLAQHTTSTCLVALTLCDIAEQTYHAKVNRDIVLAATIAHDLMKPLTYTSEEEESYGSSPLGDKMDHLTLIVAKLIEKGFPLEVVHAVAAHHGEHGPISPRTVEALICNLSDSTDAALNGEVLKAAKFHVERCTGERIEHLDAEQAFAIVNAAQSEGCEAVKRTLEKIRT